MKKYFAILSIFSIIIMLIVAFTAVFAEEKSEKINPTQTVLQGVWAGNFSYDKDQGNARLIFNGDHVNVSLEGRRNTSVSGNYPYKIAGSSIAMSGTNRDWEFELFKETDGGFILKGYSTKKAAGARHYSMDIQVKKIAEKKEAAR